MSLWFQSFPTSFDIKMSLAAHNIIPESYESNPRRLTSRNPGRLSTFTTEQLFGTSSLANQQRIVQRPGSSCSIGSNSSEVTVLPPVHNKNYQESRYKTELCRHWQENGTCPHGQQCLFAHGLNELKPFRGRHQKYKTQLCKAFHSEGFCSFGPRCSYIHSGIDIIPGAIRPFQMEPSQSPRKLSTDSIDSTLDFPSEQLEERLRMLSMGSPKRPVGAADTVPNSFNDFRLSAFAKICHK